ncbi:uncharacterized protein FA14DRAFT_161649 [Meira miltonrushii]|uniref:Uncharacterized protein n=1 Tax=Meira miltonrushii TaxID=1280837 RepID=A0A316VD21_9BASI|nr:uncharacterized protein FA14DRAFT_161649 [Meira miltonrushii]PWN34133.1 hypothetical protein FA14DRAFT_161649 [Meira miltonrushii]
MKYPTAFLFMFSALIFQVIIASPVPTTEEGNVKLNKRNPVESTVTVNDLHLRNLAEGLEAPTLVKRGHHHGWGGFGKHGFRGMFGGWRHRGRFW